MSMIRECEIEFQAAFFPPHRHGVVQKLHHWVNEADACYRQD